jgi:hypothetical protein
MALHRIEALSHESAVFSLAVSHDEGLLACGGTEDVPVTVWDLAQRKVVARLEGSKRQAHALAFSPTLPLLAAANLWGGICVWDLGSGRLVGEKPATRGRRTRTLTYPEGAHASPFPVLLSDSIARPVVRSLAPDGKLLAVCKGAVEILTYRSTTVAARLDPTRHERTRSGIGRLAWSADSKLLAVAGPGWAGVWLPFEPEPRLLAAELPFREPLGALGVLGRSMQLVYAREREIVFADCRTMPAVPLLTKWQEFLLGVPAPPAGTPISSRREWRWNVTQWGHDGVHTLSGHLLWFNATYPSHAGGWGEEQSFESFLNDGPAHPLPEPLLIEVCQAVRALAAP